MLMIWEIAPVIASHSFAEALFCLTRLTLPIPHGSIKPTLFEQFSVPSPLFDLASLKHDDLISTNHRGKPVSND